MTENMIDEPAPAIPEWLLMHRAMRPYPAFPMVPVFSGQPEEGAAVSPLSTLAETAFNNHEKNTGEHVSPFDTGLVRVGTDGLEVRLAQPINMEMLKQVVAAGTEATIGRPRPSGPGPYSDRMNVSDERWQEMFKGGLQAALESQVLVFEVWGASRILTHQLVRSRRAGFHQQSQRSTWYGDRPEVRMPETVWRAGGEVRRRWLDAYRFAWRAYKAACDEGVPYEDARYILPEGTVNYIQCEYTVREFINVYAYRGCSMFLREMVEVMRLMRELVVATTPELAQFVKVSCETKPCAACLGSGMLYVDGRAATLEERAEFLATNAKHRTPGVRRYDLRTCSVCKGTGGRKCTFQGWENVELACDKPQAKEGNRVFVAAPRLRIGAKS